jgi:hypothetical protein
MNTPETTEEKSDSEPTSGRMQRFVGLLIGLLTGEDARKKCESPITLPSKDRGCEGKMKLKNKAVNRAMQLSLKHGKQYGLYLCPHCDYYHLTTKIENADRYSAPLIYITPNVRGQATPSED